ncbi:MAG: GntR family transcriptional regulator [Thermanaerothrix sp.]|nr:GntR family transcriptional regulator [Thermanaerothrix sp.]
MLIGSTAADEAYRAVRRKIMLGELKPGERLYENALADLLGISRTPVREAFRRLDADGLINVVRNGGAWVADPSEEEIRDAFEIREVLEGMAARKGALLAKPSVIRRLEEELHREASAVRALDLEGYIDANWSFHRLVAESSGSRTLRECLERPLAKTFAFAVFHRDLFADEVGEGRASTMDHRAIIAALSAGNADEAERLMRLHVRQVASRMGFSLGG